MGSLKVGYVNLKRSFFGWFFGLVMPVQQIFYPALAALVSLVQKLFSSPQTFSLY
jgi:hypothetical protein